MVIPARVLASLAISLVILLAPSVSAGTTSFTGDLRTNATFTSCAGGCALGAANTAADYAQWAPTVETFSIAVPSAMEAVTFNYGGILPQAPTKLPFRLSRTSPRIWVSGRWQMVSRVLATWHPARIGAGDFTLNGRSGNLAICSARRQAKKMSKEPGRPSLKIGRELSFRPNE